MRSDLYARKSTADAGRSAGRQERDWRADCGREGFEPGQVFVDPDLSASRYARKARPDFARLVEHIASGRAEVISMWEASRGSRQLGEWVSFLDLCRDHGVLVRVFEDGGRTYDSRRQADREELVRLGMAAETESARLSQRVTDGNRDAAASGRPPGPLLYGFRREYGAPLDENRSASGARRREIRQLVDEAEAAIIRRLAQDTLDGVPMIVQARQLTAEGVPTPSGAGTWTGAHINRLLQNPALVGDRLHKGEIVARDAWPAILPRDQHRQLVALLSNPTRRAYVGGAPLKYMLSGAVRCDPCGTPLRTLSSLARRYCCPNAECYGTSASIPLMDGDVAKVIRARLRRIDAQAVLAPAVDDAAVARVQRELEDAQDNLNGFYEQARQRKLSASGLVAVEAGLLPEIKRLEAKLAELNRPPVLRDLAGVDVAEHFDDLEVTTRRAVVMALADLRLSRTGKGTRWSLARLGQSRWVGQTETWAELLEASGAV